MAVPEISAIVVNYRRPDILGACLHSLEAALDRTGEEWELIVVDNASGDESCDLVRREVPSARLRLVSSGDSMPSRRAASITGSLPIARISWIVATLRDCASAQRRVIGP